MPRLNEQQRARIRYHLGYLGVEPVRSIALGVPSATQPGFLVEQAMDRLMEPHVPKAVELIGILDGIECRMVGSLERLQAQQVGEVKLRNDNNEAQEGDLLEREYTRWATRLSELLGVPLNPFSARFVTRGGGINTPVMPP